MIRLPKLSLGSGGSGGGLQYGMNRQEPLSMFNHSISRGINPGSMFGSPRPSVLHMDAGGQALPPPQAQPTMQALPVGASPYMMGGGLGMNPAQQAQMQARMQSTGPATPQQTGMAQGQRPMGPGPTPQMGAPPMAAPSGIQRPMGAGPAPPAGGPAMPGAPSPLGSMGAGPAAPTAAPGAGSAQPPAMRPPMGGGPPPQQATGTQPSVPFRNMTVGGTPLQRMASGGLARAANAARSAGRFRDAHLVHLNPEEYQAVKTSFGEPTTNPKTGLPEFFSLTDTIIGALGGGLSGGKNGAISGALLAQLMGQQGGQNPAPGGTPGSGNAVNTAVRYGDGTPAAGDSTPDQASSGQGSGLNSSSSMTGNIAKYLPQLLQMAAMNYKNQAQRPQMPSNITAGLLPTSYNRTSNAYPGGPASYYTYGSRPSFDFYNNNLLPSTTAGTGTTAQAKGGPIHGGEDVVPSQGSRYMGSNFPGSGTDDTIPAKLSNSEYVMDAQTVSHLGDGNPDEGARKLDRFRKNIRMHKGKALAKGRMAPDAKEPEDYLE